MLPPARSGRKHSPVAEETEELEQRQPEDREVIALDAVEQLRPSAFELIGADRAEERRALACEICVEKSVTEIPHPQPGAAYRMPQLRPPAHHASRRYQLMGAAAQLLQLAAGRAVILGLVEPGASADE